MKATYSKILHVGPFLHTNPIKLNRWLTSGFQRNLFTTAALWPHETIFSFSIDGFKCLADPIGFLNSADQLIVTWIVSILIIWIRTIMPVFSFCSVGSTKRLFNLPPAIVAGYHRIFRGTFKTTKEFDRLDLVLTIVILFLASTVKSQLETLFATGSEWLK